MHKWNWIFLRLISILLLFIATVRCNTFSWSEYCWLLIAEWQWEQWPLQQPANLTARAPGARQGASLWRDRQARSWWLFGGRHSSGKVYSDLWRYEAASRRWTRVFPNDDSRAKSNSAGDMRTSLAAASGGGKKAGATAAGTLLTQLGNAHLEIIIRLVKFTGWGSEREWYVVPITYFLNMI